MLLGLDLFPLTMMMTTAANKPLRMMQLYIILIRPERNVRQSMMMPVARYSAMNKTTGGTGPSSMMAAIMVTAATCNQNEKIEKQQTTVYPTEDTSKLKVSRNGNANNPTTEITHPPQHPMHLHG